MVAASADTGAAATEPPIPGPYPLLPTYWLWGVPFLFVGTYVLLVLTFYRDEAHWTGAGPFVVPLTILLTTAGYSVIWFFIAWGGALTVGVFVPIGVLLLLGKLPIARRHTVIEVPDRPDTPRVVWGRFALFFLVALGFELLFMIVLFHRGLLSPRIVVSHPEEFFLDEGLGGLVLALLLAPAGPYFASRLRLRIVDTLPFPYVWLAALLFVIGGTTIALLVLLPGITHEPAVFFLSILLYAPGAWYLALGYSRAEWKAQTLFVSHVWPRRGPNLHFGQIEVHESDTDARLRV